MAELGEYKGHAITVYNDGTFHCKDLELEAESYKKLCGMIDRETKREWERVPAIRLVHRWAYGGEGSKIENVTITSLAEGTGYRGSRDVWIVDSHKKREKATSSELKADTVENHALFKKALGLYAESKRLSKEADGIIERMEKAKLPKEKSQVNDG